MTEAREEVDALEMRKFVQNMLVQRVGAAPDASEISELCV